MCGISGIVGKHHLEPGEVELLCHKLAHRGPDASGTYVSENGRVALGHNRLSIIDLSSAANQPMTSVDGRYVIVFNGEIYNFQSLRSEIERENPSSVFRTQSDTEVILHAFAVWGVKMAQRLEGMFVIAIYDCQNEKLFLFRDRVGKKPLFYFCNQGRFIFASEIKAILAHPAVQKQKEVDQQAVHEFLHLGYIPEPKTIFRAIRKFPAGSFGEIELGLSHSFESFWRWEDTFDQPLTYRNENEATEQLSGALQDAVRKRLISDVPLGTFLSGGTDSSVVTAMASRLTTKPLKTFSIGFKEDKFDERIYASKVAKLLNTDHHETVLAEAEAAALLETYVSHLDEPFADTSTIPTMLVSKISRQHVTVALTGDGGDELFLGYGAHVWAQRLANGMVKPIQFPLAAALNLFGNSRLKRIAQLLAPVPKRQLRSHIFSQEQYLFSDHELHNLLQNPLSYQPFFYLDPHLANRVLTEAEKQAFFDLKFYLKDDLLVKVDRASMFFGLECRCPFLDLGVIRAVASMPDNLKHRGGVPKYILKEILRDYLPKDLIFRKKWGFSIPLSKWLRNEFRYLIDQNLNKGVVTQLGYVKWSEVEQLLGRFFRDEDYLYNRVWTLVVLHKWLRENS